MPSHWFKHAHALPVSDHPWLLALVDVGTAFWLVLYVLAIVGGFRMRTYLIPLVAIAANFSWELIAAVFRPSSIRLWHVGDVLWMCLDAVIVWTLLRYGRQEQRIPEIRRGYYPVVGVAFLFAFIAQLALERALRDEWGFLDAYIISVMMSVLFFFMYFARRTADNISYGIAWCKFLGNGLTSAGFVSLYPLLEGRQASVPLLYALCLANCALDAGYVGLLARARRANVTSLDMASSSRAASSA